MIKENAMTAPKSMNPAEFLREQAESADPDVLRAMVKTFADG
jgi:putative transposase